MNTPMELISALQKAGVLPTGNHQIELDGKIHRFDIEGRSKGKKHGWIVGHTDGDKAFAAFGDWSNGWREKWSNYNANDCTDEQRQAFEKRRAEIDKSVNLERTRLAGEAANKAAELISKAMPVSADHPYIVSKGIRPYGAYQLGKSLLIPVMRESKVLSLQVISTNGKKFLTGGETKGCYLVLGKLNDATKILMCEGWATGSTLHEATGLPVVVCFSANNLAVVAKKMASVITCDVLVCGDNDHATEGNPGKVAAMKAANCFVGGLFILPSFTTEQVERFTLQYGKAPTDWNDLHQLEGLTAVQLAINQAALTEQPTTPMEPEEITDLTKNAGAAGAIGADSQKATDDDRFNLTDADDDKIIQYLAALSTLEYERVRAKALKRLQIQRSSVLDTLVRAARKELQGGQDGGTAGGCILFDDVEPWPVPVDGAAMLEDIYQLLARYVIADRETLRAASLWAALTWFAEYATVLPLAVITAPEKGCGKSTLLTALAKLACRPLYASNITPAAIFRAIEKWLPTLLIDEADTFAKDNEELRGVINAGHTRETATIVRVVESGGEYEPRAFSVWGPKAMAGIGNMPETIMSRAIVLTMRRKMPDENAENLRHCDRAAFYDVKRRLARWSDDNGDTFATLRPVLEGIHNRDADNWEPLLALADIAGGEWPKIARHAAIKLTGSDEEAPSLNEELLNDIKTVLERTKADRISTVTLLEELCKDDESAWATYNHGRPVTARQLAKRLGGFGIKPKPLRVGLDVVKGYTSEQFREVFARYLLKRGQKSVTRLQPAPAVGCSGSPIGYTQDHVTDRKKLEAAPAVACNHVTDKMPKIGGCDAHADENGVIEVEI